MSFDDPTGAASHEAAPAVVRFVSICRANVARSPLAAVALAAASRDHGLRSSIVSAGVAARPGQPAAAESIAIAARHGWDISGHRSTPVAELAPTDRDVIVTMSPAQRDRLHQVGWPPTRVFTLVELAELLRHVEGDAGDAGDDDGLFGFATASVSGPLAVVEDAARSRPVVPLTAALEVDDPYGRGEAAFDAAWSRIEEAATTVVAVLARVGATA